MALSNHSSAQVLDNKYKVYRNVEQFAIIFKVKFPWQFVMLFMYNLFLYLNFQ